MVDTFIDKDIHRKLRLASTQLVSLLSNCTYVDAVDAKELHWWYLG